MNVPLRAAEKSLRGFPAWEWQRIAAPIVIIEVIGLELALDPDLESEPG